MATGSQGVSLPNGHSAIPRTSSSSRTPPPRCTRCNRPKSNGRNLVVCIDGTSNQFGQNNTNVVKLFAKIDLESRNPEQYAYYSSGIGTRPKSIHIINRMERAVSDKLDMAIAWNMEEILKDAYGWLARTYQEGDQIYLFGFSRGAYQVRVLAGMIYEVGLIRTPTEKQIGAAYDHYESIRSGKPKTREIAREFKNTFSWKDLGVHFVGVWDTVSSVGFIRGDVFLSTSASASHACHFRHALALDERRVKFMPEYFHEMNSQTEDVKATYVVTSVDKQPKGIAPSDKKSQGIATSSRVQVDSEQVATSASEQRESARSTHPSEGKKATEIKEVWFAGSHSDVGGKNKPGKSYQAGNASLLWMRREAALSGLVLQSTDIVWVPDDIDFGISDSMGLGWGAIEYLPVKHQVTFSGAGDDAWRWHRRQPRRIIPGQKVHASILYANAYRPLATLGEGFEIPILRAEIENLDDQFWETGLFDDTAAQELVKYLSNPQGVPPIYLDRLLFMLRFKEGKQCLQKVQNWRGLFEDLIHDAECSSLVRLVTIVAYYEASWDPTKQESPSTLSPDVYDNARECLKDILTKHKHRDGPRVVALLRPLTKHPYLRERILKEDVLEKLVELLDKTIAQSRRNFGQAMDGLSCLLECEDTQKFAIDMLAGNLPNTNMSRLSRILEVDNPHLLTSALRMILALAGIPQARNNRELWAEVKPRIRKLASKKERLVGLLAVEILLALYNQNDEGQLNIRNPDVRANLARALFRLNTNRRDSDDEQACSADREGQIFRDLFGMDAKQLTLDQTKLISKLKKAVEKGNTRERTAVTMTLLKLCDTPAIRTYLNQINLLNVFVKQLRRKESALLAAYALAVCLKHEDMQSIKKNDDLPRQIVNMLRLDYFDDAVGPVEGFQVFGDLMQHVDLRDKITRYDITAVLRAKLAKGKEKETRTSLICLEIFRFFDQGGPWTVQLVEKSLALLRNQDWKSQKAGVTILSALAQTKNGVEIIEQRVHEIVGILLPEGYLPIQLNLSATSADPTPRGERRPQRTATAMTEFADPPLRDSPSKPPSWMMGPACPLRILAQNETLRTRTRGTIEYGSLKHLYLSGMLVDEADTLAFQVWTPNRTDVTNMLDKLIKAVDGELSEDGLMSIGDTVLPHIRHWDRLGKMIRDETIKVASIIPLLGVSALAILALVVAAPIFASVRLYKFFRTRGSRYQDGRILDRLLSGVPGVST